MVRKKKTKRRTPAPAAEEVVLSEDDEDTEGEGYELEVPDAADYVPSEAEKKAKRQAAAKKAWATRKGKKGEETEGLEVKSEAPAVKPVAKRGEVFVYRRFYESGELTDEEIEELDEDEVPLIKVREFLEPPTAVNVHATTTVNLGDYSSIKYGVSLTGHCYWEEKDDCFAVIDEWVTSKVQKATEEAEAERDSSPTIKRRRRRS